ncbi:ead/Ea22-like family protein [Pseudomonas aeruginosa]|uniref:ead/Ea22-like family protein n=1 Tax=Pseudomonas aeruginosa TaxID=287 RepID=UPI001F529F63|nr:ead/Ea22-like family protein [Pseudomonas aeruginosa]MCI0909593.1 ead/Ea22-like family protein [Pseudomonas aeruginosa]
MTDHAELRRLAKAATPGPWVTDAQKNGAIFNIESESGDMCIAMSQENPAPTRLEINEQRRANAEWIAAANPKTILALLDEIDGLRSRLEIDERTPHDGIACRDETIKVLDEKCDRLKAENEALRRFAAEVYQVLGALDAPENVLDNASDAANGVPLRHETLLPFFAEDYEALRKDAERWRYARTILPYEVIQDAQKDLESWNVGVSEAENKRCDEAIDAALEGATQ